MRLTNLQIYNYAVALNEVFNDENQKLPIKINFYLQKNKNTLLNLGQDIEQNRMNIAREYGQLSEDGEHYIIPADKLEMAQKEISDLFALEQDVNIYTINIDNLDDNLTLTTAQMEALMFMID